MHRGHFTSFPNLEDGPCFFLAKISALAEASSRKLMAAAMATGNSTHSLPTNRDVTCGLSKPLLGDSLLSWYFLIFIMKRHEVLSWVFLPLLR